MSSKSNVNMKEVIYKIHTTRKIIKGGFCTFIHLNNTKGLKIYGTKGCAISSHKSQKKFLKLKLAPKIYSSVFEIPYLFLEWEEDNSDRVFAVNHLKRYGYITEIVETKFKKREYKDQIPAIRKILKKYNIRLDDLVGDTDEPPRWDNLGVINKKLIIVDFDPCTIYERQ